LIGEAHEARSVQLIMITAASLAAAGTLLYIVLHVFLPTANSRLLSWLGTRMRKHAAAARQRAKFTDPARPREKLALA